MGKIGIHFGHDSTIAYSPYPGVYRSYELERFTKKRYFALDAYGLFTTKKYDPNTTKEIFLAIKDQIVKEFGEEYLKIDSVTYDQKYPEVNQPFDDTGELVHDNIFKLLRETFVIEESVPLQARCHHTLHSYSAFFQSPFEEAFVISFDGGGLTEHEEFAQYFTGYYMTRKGLKRQLFTRQVHLCSLYNAFPYLCKDIRGNINSTPGKAMGLSGYGEWDDKLYRKLEPLFNSQDWITTHVNRENGTGWVDNEYLYDVVKETFGLKDKKQLLEFDNAATFLATVQVLFEDTFLKHIKPHAYKLNLPIVITGGGALNVLNNCRVKNEIGLPVYIPCNPNDTGTAIGGIFEKDLPNEQIDLRFCNWDLFDRENLFQYVDDRKGKKYNHQEVAGLIREGKIIGVVRGRSECGPRALGNRSIICDPSFPNMKDILNSKVKHREWYRPFAPMVLQEDAKEYFAWDDAQAPNMSFACLVKSKEQERLSSITHADYTARIQTINQKDNPWYYDLLKEMKSTGPSVILNTSFNILGKPILNSIEDAFYVLDNTELDYLIIEDYIFSK